MRRVKRVRHNRLRLLMIVSLAASATIAAMWIRSRYTFDALFHGRSTARSYVYWRIGSVDGAVCWHREAMYLDADSDFSGERVGYRFESNPAGDDSFISFAFYPTWNR